MVCGEVFAWDGRILAKIVNLLLGWQDGWCGDQPFHLAFPRLYGIAIDKEISVEASLSRQGAEDRRIWDVCFI